MSRTALDLAAHGSQLTAHVFSLPVRVYWEDTDAGGVVYHASYLRFLERARSEWLRSRGVEQQRLRTEHDILFVVADVNLRFLTPARLDDELDVCVTAFTRRSASLLFTQCILRRADRATIVEASVRAACISAASYRPRRIPDFLLHENPCSESAAEPKTTGEPIA